MKRAINHTRTASGPRSRVTGGPNHTRSFAVAALSVLASIGAALGAVNISAPGAQSRTHNGADAPQPFPQQTWTLTSNELLGATVQFTTSAFTNGSESSVKADCKLDLVVLSGVGWAAIIPTDQTNIAINDQTASVSARSTLSGNATVGLTVTFQNSDFSTVEAGDYTLTVTGTIVPNL